MDVIEVFFWEKKQTMAAAALVIVATALIAGLAPTIMSGVALQRQDSEAPALYQQGTFIWAMADRNGYIPGSTCWFPGRINNVFVNSAGTGYRVGDLIVAQHPGGPQFFSFVYQVSEVDPLDGAVVSYDVLTDGCIESTANVTLTTMSTHGTGFEVVVNSDGGPGSDPNANDGELYLYPLPPGQLLAPLQVSQYRVYTISRQDGTQELALEIDPPAVPIRMSSGGGTQTQFAVYLYGFNNSVVEMNTLADWWFTSIIPPKMLSQFDLRIDTACPTCFVSGTNGGNARSRNALTYGGVDYTIGARQFMHNFVLWNYGSPFDAYDFRANNATFTLKRPVRWLLQPI